MFSFIYLSAFISSLEKNHKFLSKIKKNNPTLTFNLPEEFSTFLNLQTKKAEIKKLSGPLNYSLLDVPYYWWDFNGSQIQQSDPYSYSLDSDNWPDCTNVSGNTYCEIKAHADTDDSSIPDLSTIDAIRYQPF